MLSVFTGLVDIAPYPSIWIQPDDCSN